MKKNTQKIENAYWISPYGEIKGLSMSTHIKELCNHPDGFWVSEKWLENTFNKYKEKWATEGQAKEEIIIRLVKRGWIRVSKYKKTPERWAMNVGEVNAVNVNYIRGFAKYLLKNHAHELEEIWIDTPGECSVKISLREAAEGKLSKEVNLPERKQKFLLQWVSDFTANKDEVFYRPDLTIGDDDQSPPMERFPDLVDVLKKMSPPAACTTNGKDYQAVCKGPEYQNALGKLKARVAELEKVQTKDYLHWDAYHRKLVEKWERYTPKGWAGILYFDAPRQWLQVVDKVLDFILRFDQDFEIHQIKMKWGGLRFYVETGLKSDLQTQELFALMEKKMVNKSLIY